MLDSIQMAVIIKKPAHHIAVQHKYASSIQSPLEIITLLIINVAAKTPASFYSSHILQMAKLRT